MPPSTSMRALPPLGVFAMLFGTLTVFSGARGLFGPAAAQAALGQVVPWVLWFNFVAGFAYVAVGWGLWRGVPRWALRGSVLLAACTGAVALALGLHIAQGGGFEMRTVAAMVLRLGFWGAVVWVAWSATQPAHPAAPR